MDPSTLIYFSFILIAFFVMAYFYWKDSAEEGYSSSRIFDSYFIIITGCLLGGKLLFRPINWEYLRYQLWSSPFIIEGIFLGGLIGLFIYIKHNKIAGWKIGDMLAAALTSFQSLITLGIAIITGSIDYYIISALFFITFLILRYLRIKKNMGSSRQYFEQKRYNKLLITGGLITIYLTVLSLVAILFLVKNNNIYSNFWRFQLGFYLVILFSTYIAFRRKLTKESKK